ncbi:hypothetical protein GCM10009527_025380 [Actinomadura nitritigenes]|uniref:Integral membrane protein n=1 Tax=Actinomadura nitritigenes TaxID=134602 RepID=A0ABS3R092_9ACTN|nr:hypothetical protein [Actinomadura nitritigenes]MBO2439442.1 hypothetical protein [Actinomadura nitritigenes]
MTTRRLPREDLAAALAARRELGPDYDAAFIETVVDRIEEALDARPAAPAPRRRPRVPRPSGDGDHGLLLAVLSMVAAIPLSAIAAVNAGGLGLFLAWSAIVLINIAYNFRPR